MWVLHINEYGNIGCINFNKCTPVGRAYTLCDLKQALLLELNGGYVNKFQFTFLAHPSAPPATEWRVAFGLTVALTPVLCESKAVPFMELKFDFNLVSYYLCLFLYPTYSEKFVPFFSKLQVVITS